MSEQSSGRFPSNLILMHHEDCECVGTKKVKNPSGSVTGREPRRLKDSIYVTGIHNRNGFLAYGNQDGTETVSDWRCHPTCPVKRLDDQSGMLHSRGNLGPTKTRTSFWDGSKGKLHVADSIQTYDSGGASRFFKHVTSYTDLIDYLTELITPPEKEQNMTATTHYVGPPVDDWSALMDTLVPGANLMIVMPKQDYYRTACEVEDEGFEIRDCLTVLMPQGRENLAVLWAIKPREGTYVDNALKHGVAGLNIDAGRLRVSKDDPNRRPNRA